jgi:hypothetical protein
LPAVTVKIFDVVVNERRVVGVFDVAKDTNVLDFRVIPDALGEGFGVGVGEGVALALGEGFGVGVGVALALGVGVGVGEGVGVGVGVGVGEGVGVITITTATGSTGAGGAGMPPPPPPPPPPLWATGAAAIVKTLVTVDATRYLVVADALAVTEHEPAAVNVTVEPETVQFPLAV